MPNLVPTPESQAAHELNEKLARPVDKRLAALLFSGYHAKADGTHYAPICLKIAITARLNPDFRETLIVVLGDL